MNTFYKFFDRSEYSRADGKPVRNALKMESFQPDGLDGLVWTYKLIMYEQNLIISKWTRAARVEKRHSDSLAKLCPFDCIFEC